MARTLTANPNKDITAVARPTGVISNPSPLTGNLTTNSNNNPNMGTALHSSSLCMALLAMECPSNRRHTEGTRRHHHRRRQLLARGRVRRPQMARSITTTRRLVRPSGKNRLACLSIMARIAGNPKTASKNAAASLSELFDV